MQKLTRALLPALPLVVAACGEDVAPPPPTGSVAGQVSIEGQGADGVSVALSSGAATATAGGGSYRFDDVEPGSYTVSISGFPAEASFDATSMPVTVGESGGTATVDFSGAYIRTASVRGSVTIEGNGLSGITVRLSGMSDAEAMTDASGQYSFTGLRAGRYSVEISGFDADEVGFPSTSGSADLGVGDTEVVSFDGTYLRTAGIRGQVSVEGSGLSGVTVSLSGEGDDRTTTTDAGGQYAFSKLRAGDYSVAVSGYDSDAIGFDATSQSVTVALGETANVRFDGAYLRTSGVVGQVSVAGSGLADIAVTLASADMDSMTDTTDASGFYSFSALAAGDYTVSIMVASEAYVFSMTSMDVTLADDESATVNFQGEHATTASVSGMLFVDEAMKNDMHDQGEDTLEIAGIPVVLVGPAVGDQMSGMTDERGMFEFSGLRAGTYALAVVSNPAVATMLGDYAYGGPATGYQLNVAVGQAVMQHLPYDITHQTVHYTVTLRHGDIAGDTLAGATVTLYADEDGDSKIASADTDDDGMASIRFARSMATGSMVWASVSSDDYTVEADAMQKIEWNAKSKMAMAMNDFDVLNLMVDAKISGATVMTDMGGGKPLADWAISVTMGGKAVDGAPTKLGADGTAMFETTAMASDLPAMYTVTLDSTQADKLDGGETFSSTPVTIEHSGLELMQTMDADMLEAMWTTQTLTVYVHHEMDQAEGYTGSVLGGDKRMSGKIDVDVRYIDELGRSRMFASDVWDPKNKSDKGGVIAFKHLPADALVMVSAREKSTATDVMLLDPMELFAFRDAEANGIVKGAFGDHGGFSPMVELCPLTATEPAGQDFGECGTFAYVMKHKVSGTVWRNAVTAPAGRDDFTTSDMGEVVGVTVGLMPVRGKNLAGTAHSQTTAKANAKATTWDDRNAFDFGKIAAGAYELTVPAGWRATLGAKGSTTEVGDAFTPLDGDATLDVTPATGTVYGVVTGSDGFRLDSVTVEIGDMSAATDMYGRYVIAGLAPDGKGMTVKVARNGSATTLKTDSVVKANALLRYDVAFDVPSDPVYYSGKVVESGSGAPLAGVEIMVDGEARDTTGADGTFRAQIAAKGANAQATVEAQRDRYTFAPGSLTMPAHAGTDLSGLAFTGFKHATIIGRVVKPEGDGPMSGVSVKARKAGDTTVVLDSATTRDAGMFVLSVPYGDYDVRASKMNHGFDYPRGTRRVSVAPGERRNFGKIQVNTWLFRGISATRAHDTTDTVLTETPPVLVHKWSGNVIVNYSNRKRTPGNDYGLPAAGQPGPVFFFEFQSAAGRWTLASPSYLTADGTKTEKASEWTGTDYLLNPVDPFPDDTFDLRIRYEIWRTLIDPTSVLAADTVVVQVPAIDPRATAVAARRGADSIVLDWVARTNSRSEQRIAATFASIADLGGFPATVFLTSGLTWETRRHTWSGFGNAAETREFRTADNGSVIRVTNQEMKGAIKFRIDSRQGSSGAWRKGTSTAKLAAVGSG